MSELIPLGSALDIADGETKTFTIDATESTGTQEIFLVNFDGLIHAYKNNCPHLNIELNYQPNQFLNDEKNFIVCANHGAIFTIETGECIAGPCSGQSLEKLSVIHKGDQLYIEPIN